MRSSATRTWGRSLTLVLALALVLTPVSAHAQAQHKGVKRWLFGAVGAVVIGGGTLILMNSLASSENNTGCASTGCVTVLATGMGFGMGYLIGNDIDKKNARKFAAGPTLKYDYKNFPLGMVPDRMTTFPGGAAIVGLGGARIVMRDGTISSRALGVRGIEDVAILPSSQLLVLSTHSSLIAFPMGDADAQGQVIDERGGGSMEAVSDQLAVAGRDSLRMLSLRAGDSEWSVETLSSLETFDYVADIAYSSFSGLTWVLTDDILSAYDSDLGKIAEVTLPASGRTVRVSGTRLAVAAGTNGAFVFDVTNPVAPQMLRTFSGVRFAYSADIDGDLLYVAAGTEGVAVVDIRSANADALGVARGVRFASDVMVAGDSEIWILDREGRQIQKAEFQVTDSS